MKIYLALLSLILPFSSFAVDWQKAYRDERDSMTQEEILQILDRGNALLEKTDLVRSLIEGGSAFFPHCYIRMCGDQIAAVAKASLLAAVQSGKFQILVLGVLHNMTEELLVARRREMQDLDVTNDPLRGIFGPDLPEAGVLRKEFSVEHFLFLLHRISELERIPMPQVIVRYPNLVQGNTGTLPGIEALQELAAHSIVVATSDLCHHGAPYGIPEESRLPIGASALSFARESIERCLDILSTNNLSAYRKMAYATNSDSACVGQIMNAILGPLKGKIQDIKLLDYAPVFDKYPGPIWVAATLVELKPL